MAGREGVKSAARFQPIARLEKERKASSLIVTLTLDICLDSLNEMPHTESEDEPQIEISSTASPQ